MKLPIVRMAMKNRNWKHCFPVSGIEEDKGDPDIDSEDKRTENYKLHYTALKTKIPDFPKNKFVVWTGAAQVKNVTLRERMISILKGKSIVEENAKRARAFF